MAEGFGYNPNDRKDTSQTDETIHIPTRIIADKFKLFIGDLFRPKEKKEDDEDNEKHEVGAEKKGRFARVWSMLFRGSIVEKEDVAADTPRTPSKGLFFEMSAARSDAETPAPERTPLDSGASVPNRHEVPARETVEPVLKEEISQSFDAEPSEPEDVTEQVSERSEVATEPAAEQAPAQREAILVPRRVDRYYTPNQPQHETQRRVDRAERRQDAAEKDLKAAVLKIDHLEKKSSSQAPEVRRVLQQAPEKLPAVTSIEAAKAVRPEVLRAAKKAIEAEPQKLEKVRAVAERQELNNKPIEKEKVYSVTPEVQKVVDKLEASESKEIAYELSHEHKDLDKQSAAAWATLQATASANARTNAKAIALAQAASRQAASPGGSTVINDSADAKQSLYKQAALGGFVSAVVIIAIIFVILLLK